MTVAKIWDGSAWVPVVGAQGPPGPQGPAGPSTAIQLVTALPSSPVDGQEVYYQNAAMATDGIVWHLRYRAASASPYKWEYVGGGSLFTSIEGSTTMPAGTNADGTNITLPLAGDYEVEVGVTASHTAGQLTVGVGQTGILLDVFVDTLSYVPVMRAGRLPGLVVGTTLKIYGVVPGGASATFWRRYLRARPVRVG